MSDDEYAKQLAEALTIRAERDPGAPGAIAFGERFWIGEAKPPEPSPGPWRVKRDPILNHGYVWVVLDANDKCVAECDRQIDALFIAQNGPREAKPNKPESSGGPDRAATEPGSAVQEADSDEQDTPPTCARHLQRPHGQLPVLRPQGGRRPPAR